MAKISIFETQNGKKRGLKNFFKKIQKNT